MGLGVLTIGPISSCGVTPLCNNTKEVVLYCPALSILSRKNYLTNSGSVGTVNNSLDSSERAGF